MAPVALQGLEGDLAVMAGAVVLSFLYVSHLYLGGARLEGEPYVGMAYLAGELRPVHPVGEYDGTHDLAALRAPVEHHVAVGVRVPGFPQVCLPDGRGRLGSLVEVKPGPHGQGQYRQY